MAGIRAVWTNYFRRGIEPDSGIRGKRMSEATALIAEIKSKGLLRAGDKLEELYVVAARIQADNLALKAQRDALASENKILDSAIGAIADAHATGIAELLENEIDIAVNSETPATEAYLNSVRADAITSALETCTDHCDTDYVMDAYDLSYEIAGMRSAGAIDLHDELVAFADQLRVGKDGE